ncbi:MAG: hypothetical protein AAFX54_03230 [Pseudomonadota bacterium]
MHTTIGIRGKNVSWPPGCSCCGRETRAVRRVKQYYTATDAGAPVERVVKLTAVQTIPMCAQCKGHVENAEHLGGGCTLAWVFSVIAATGIYFWLLVDIRAPWNYIAGIATLAGVTILAWSVMNALFKEKSQNVTPTCKSPDGVVRYTGFVAPTELYPGVVEVHRFTFNDEDYCQRFIALNGRAIERFKDADNWDAAPQESV